MNRNLSTNEGDREAVQSARCLVQSGITPSGALRRLLLVVSVLGFGALARGAEPVESIPQPTVSAGGTSGQAAFNRGVVYHEGKGVRPDYQEARKWYLEAVEGGSYSALYNLGQLYRKGGPGLRKNHAEALAWYARAAEGGTDRGKALNAMAMIYEAGEGVPRNPAKALKLYHQAASLGSIQAMYNLSICYQQGKDRPRDYEKTLCWLNKAAEKGYPDAMYNIGIMYFNGDYFRKDYRMALEWYKRAAAASYAACGSPEGEFRRKAMHNIGVIYDEGLAGMKDPVQAFAWYKKAAERGLPESMANVGIAYAQGSGVRANTDQAIYWLEMSVKRGLISSAFALGYLYETKNDIRSAIKWYAMMADSGNVDAMIALVRMHPQESEKVRWLRRAARAGHGEARQFCRENGISW